MNSGPIPETSALYDERYSNTTERKPTPIMTQLTLYEEAMCCSTGVCGPDPDDELVEVSAALDQLEEAFDDVEVSRANMQHDIDEFLDTQRIYDLVQENGPSILPITVVDDEIVAKAEYLSYDEMVASVEGRPHTQEA